MHAINYKFVRQLGYSKMRQGDGSGKEARWGVLFSLWSHANIRNRAWSSIPTMMNEAGFSDNHAIAGALTYLQEHGAIYLVPNEYRVEDEPKHKQIRVWQLTGIIKIDGEWQEYLLVNDEHLESLIREATRMGVESVFTSYFDNPCADHIGESDNRCADHMSTDVLTTYEGKSDSSFKKEYSVSSAKADDTTGNFSASGNGDVQSESTDNEVEGDRPTKVDESKLPQYVLLMLDICKAKWKNVSQTMREDIQKPMSCWDDKAEKYDLTAPTPEVFDKEPLYRAWIRDIIIPELRHIAPGKNVARGQFLSQTQNYLRFQKFLKSEYGKRFASRVRIAGAGSLSTMPQGERVVTAAEEVPDIF